MEPVKVKRMNNYKLFHMSDYWNLSRKKIHKITIIYVTIKITMSGEIFADVFFFRSFMIPVVFNLYMPFLFYVYIINTLLTVYDSPFFTYLRSICVCIFILRIYVSFVSASLFLRVHVYNIYVLLPATATL